MKITGFEVHGIHLPLKKPFVVAYQTYDYMPSIILKLQTDAGIVGYGEGVPDQHVTGEEMMAALVLLENILPELIGMDVAHISRIHDVMNRTIIDNPALKAAVDLACYDAMGKAFNVPVYDILGGRTKERLEYAKVISIGSKDEILTSAEQALAAGFNVLKLKVGSDYLTDIDNIKALRDAVPNDIEIRVDANQGWQQDAAAVRFSDLDKLKGIAWLEQPFGIHDFRGAQLLKEKLPVALMLDESIKNTNDLLVALQYEALDYVNVKLMKTGGIYPALKLINLAESYGIPCQIGSMVESSIGSSAGYQLAMAANNVTSTELTGPLLFSRDVGNLKYEVPYVLLTEAPGLGIEIDETTLNELTVKHLKVEEHD